MAVSGDVLEAEDKDALVIGRNTSPGISAGTVEGLDAETITPVDTSATTITPTTNGQKSGAKSRGQALGFHNEPSPLRRQHS